MYRIKVHSGINGIFSIFKHIGWWDDDEDKTKVQTKLSKNLKLFLFLFYASFSVSLVTGAITSDNAEDSSFLTVIALAATVQLFKLYYIIWRSTEIRAFIANVGSFTVGDRNDFHQVEEKLNFLMKFVKYLVTFLIAEATVVFVFDAVSAVWGNRFLLFNIGFPLDWRHGDVAYWMAYGYVLIQSVYATIIFSLDIIVWYLMLTFTVKLQLIGNRLSRLNECQQLETMVMLIGGGNSHSTVKDLIAVIETHKRLKE